jgi:hypothetical protein
MVRSALLSKENDMEEYCVCSQSEPRIVYFQKHEVELAAKLFSELPPSRLNHVIFSHRNGSRCIASTSHVNGVLTKWASKSGDRAFYDAFEQTKEDRNIQNV